MEFFTEDFVNDAFLLTLSSRDFNRAWKDLSGVHGQAHVYRSQHRITMHVGSYKGKMSLKFEAKIGGIDFANMTLDRALELKSFLTQVCIYEVWKKSELSSPEAQKALTLLSYPPNVSALRFKILISHLMDSNVFLNELNLTLSAASCPHDLADQILFQLKNSTIRTIIGDGKFIFARKSCHDVFKAFFESKYCFHLPHLIRLWVPICHSPIDFSCFWTQN
ncbi:hypothetical protein L596_027257 [Steinernema carpocapsae]|uniref:Uncharacterized protein n=1 Tax=Steinernema carpocapsae TaxID=34508 RepID=A0A4U5M3Y1_STECR|nr:hypothetical protein L596_027257 [Steinernema carpocapsae]